MYKRTCEIIKGKAYNIKENANHPMAVFDANAGALERLLYFARLDTPPKVCFVGASCMYPVRDSALREEMLGTGEVYPGNALYSYLKLLGWQICKAAGGQFFLVIPSDLFGTVDSSHFITQIMRKMIKAKHNDEPILTLWGTGTAIRHPLFEDDFEKILARLCDEYEGKDPINVAPPVSWAKSIASMVLDIQDVVGYKGTIEWDAAHPDGQKVKILDNSKMTLLGYAQFTPWKEALKITYDRLLNDFLLNME